MTVIKKNEQPAIIGRLFGIIQADSLSKVIKGYERKAEL